MASMKMAPIGPDFNMNDVVAKVAQTYQAKGYTVIPTPMGAGVSMDFRKDDDGIKKFLGMSTGVRANITVNNDALTVSYDDEDWTVKLIVLVLGIIFSAGCIGIALVITSIIGIINQSGLTNKIHTDITMAASGGAPFGAPAGQPYAAPPPPAAAPYAPASCPQCGTVMNSGSQFCPNCGAKAN